MGTQDNDPPFDDSPACPFCPTIVRSLYAAAFNACTAFENRQQDEARAVRKMTHLREELDWLKAKVDAHFADEAHAFPTRTPEHDAQLRDATTALFRSISERGER
jgi:hypothetical protein